MIFLGDLFVVVFRALFGHLSLAFLTFFGLYFGSMASPVVEDLNSEKVVRPNKRPFKKCSTCGGLNYNASKCCKIEGCGAAFQIKSVEHGQVVSVGVFAGRGQMAGVGGAAIGNGSQAGGAGRGQVGGTAIGNRSQARGVEHGQVTGVGVFAGRGQMAGVGSAAIGNRSQARGVEHGQVAGVGGAAIGNGSQAVSAERGKVEIVSVCPGRGQMAGVGGAANGNGSQAGGAGPCQVAGVGGASGGNAYQSVGAGCAQVTGVSTATNSSGSLAGDTGHGQAAAAKKESNGVAYVVDGEILSVGIVDENRVMLHGHKIEKGFACVLITYITKPTVTAPVLLGDPEDNSHLQKGMFFVLPIPNLFRCEKYIAGDKVVLRAYHTSKNVSDKRIKLD